MKTLDYLEELRRLAPRPTVYAIAQLLDLPEQTVHAWAHSERCPDAYACVKIAEALDLDPLRVIADIEAEREKDEGKKAAWKDLARKLACFTTGALILATTTYAPRSDASADTPRVDPLQIMQRLARWLRFGRFPAYGS